MAWIWIFTSRVTKVVEEKMVILQFVVDRAFFAKEVPKVPKFQGKRVKTIGAHKVNHISTPNQLLVDCESALTSPHDMGKSTLTKV